MVAEIIKFVTKISKLVHFSILITSSILRVCVNICSRRIYSKVYDLLTIRQKFIESSRSMRYLLKILSLTFQKRESTIWEQMFHLSLMAWGYHDKDQKYSFYFFSLPTSKWFHFLILYNINYIPASIISLKSHLQ